MKGKTLKKITVILLVLLICLISFAGIYAKDLNKIVNIIPEYKVGMDFGEIREVRLNICEETKTKYFDADGNEVKSSEGENITSKEVPVNPEEILTR